MHQEAIHLLLRCKPEQLHPTIIQEAIQLRQDRMLKTIQVTPDIKALHTTVVVITEVLNPVPPTVIALAALTIHPALPQVRPRVLPRVMSPVDHQAAEGDKEVK